MGIAAVGACVWGWQPSLVAGHRDIWRSVGREAAGKPINPWGEGTKLPVINDASTAQAADVCAEDPGH